MMAACSLNPTRQSGNGIVWTINQPTAIDTPKTPSGAVVALVIPVDNITYRPRRNMARFGLKGGRVFTEVMKRRSKNEPCADGL